MGLSEQQRYLLGRLPSVYDIERNDDKNKPTNVRAAERVIERYVEQQQRKNKARKLEFQKALNSVREAIYFKQPGDALKAVRELEAKFGEKSK